jgi:hypothetical protein
VLPTLIVCANIVFTVTRAAKRARTSSTTSNISAPGTSLIQSFMHANFLTGCLDIVITRPGTPFDPLTPGESTACPSELGTSEAASETCSVSTDTVDRRYKAKLRRQNASNPTVELSKLYFSCCHILDTERIITPLDAELVRIKASKCDVYMNYKDPVIIHKDDGPPTHHGFECKQSVLCT